MGVQVQDHPMRWTSRKSISFVEVAGRIFVYAHRVLFAESSIVSVFLDSASPMVSPIGYGPIRGPSSLLK